MNLPAEMLDHITQFLRCKDKVRLYAVNSELRVFDNPRTWIRTLQDRNAHKKLRRTIGDKNFAVTVDMLTCSDVSEKIQIILALFTHESVTVSMTRVILSFVCTNIPIGPFINTLSKKLIKRNMLRTLHELVSYYSAFDDEMSELMDITTFARKHFVRLVSVREWLDRDILNTEYQHYREIYRQLFTERDYKDIHRDIHRVIHEALYMTPKSIVDNALRRAIKMRNQCSASSERRAKCVKEIKCLRSKLTDTQKMQKLRIGY